MNLPASLIKNKCDILIGVSLTPVVGLLEKELNSSIKILTRVLELNINNNSEAHKNMCDVLIESKAISRISKYALGDYQLLYTMGYQETLAALKKTDCFKLLN